MNFLKLFDQFIFDLDGVVYIENKTTYKASYVLETLRNNNKDILFITNNPTKSPLEYKNKLKSLGISSKKKEFITSPMAINHYLSIKYKNPTQLSAFIIGSDYLKREVKKTGIRSTRGKKSYNADIVIMGSHSKFNFNEIKTATIAIRNGSDFIATNKDYFYPTQLGMSPATGSLLSSIEYASQKDAVIVGKPNRYIFDLIKSYTSVKKNKTLLIGDNLETDIIGGNRAGFSTAISLTGYTDQKEIKSSKIKPDFIIKNLTSLLN